MIGLTVIAYISLALGAFFSIVGGIGIVRLPEFYSRLHGGGITDTLGAMLIIIGLCFLAGDWLVVVKLLMILFFLFVTSPSSCHALARSALSQGVEPVLEINSVRSNESQASPAKTKRESINEEQHQPDIELGWNMSPAEN